MRVLGVAAAAGLLAAFCGSNREERMAMDFAEAKLHYEESLGNLREGRLSDASLVYRRTESFFENWIETDPSQAAIVNEVVEHKALGEWQNEWRDGYYDGIEESWDTITKRVLSGELSIPTAKGSMGFMQRDRPALYDRLTRRLEATVESARAAAAPTQYSFDCSFFIIEFCEALADAIEPRLGRFGLYRGRSDDTRYLGRVRIGVEPTRWASYSGGADGGTIPSAVSVTFEVETHRGSSSWDGKKTFAGEAHAPSSIEPGGMTEARARIGREMAEDVSRQLAELPGFTHVY